MPQHLYILYNASASIMGKMNYTYRKLTAPKDKPACAACDITHGGLHLDETGAWKEVKAELGREGVVVEQMHRDEVGGEVKEFVLKERLEYPMVLVKDGKGVLRCVMSSEELASFGGSPERFVGRLREKAVFSSESSSSL